MHKILFIRNPKAYLPEISAYCNYFNNHEQFQAFDSKDLPDNVDLSQFDVIWEFMGRGGTTIQNHQVSVHEYVSLSTGRFPRTKNMIKSLFNAKPDLRVFLNPDVKKDFKFRDNIPFVYRDMGIDPVFIQQGKQTVVKEYDFVYTGVINSTRGMDIFIRDFCHNPPGQLLLIGEVSEEIAKDYGDHPNLTFTGVLPYKKVPYYASKARYGINYMPNKYPYNIQTSTKLIEYLALGLDIITTDYQWVREFEAKYQLKFHYFDQDNKINLAKVHEENFENTFEAQKFLWDELIEESNVAERLLHLLEP